MQNLTHFTKSIFLEFVYQIFAWPTWGPAQDLMNKFKQNLLLASSEQLSVKYFSVFSLILESFKKCQIILNPYVQVFSYFKRFVHFQINCLILCTAACLVKLLPKLLLQLAKPSSKQVKGWQKPHLSNLNVNLTSEWSQVVLNIKGFSRPRILAQFLPLHKEIGNPLVLTNCTLITSCFSMYCLTMGDLAIHYCLVFLWSVLFIFQFLASDSDENSDDDDDIDYHQPGLPSTSQVGILVSPKLSRNVYFCPSVLVFTITPQGF